MENGAICVVEAAFNVPDAASESSIAFYGTKGCIIANDTLSQVEGGNVKLISVADGGDYDAAQNRATNEAVNLEVDFGNMYQKETEAFSEAVRGKRNVPVSARDAILSQKAIENLYK